MGIHECVVTSIKRADLDLRKTLYSNIVLSGIVVSSLLSVYLLFVRWFNFVPRFWRQAVGRSETTSTKGRED